MQHGYRPLTVLPQLVQQLWQARLHQATPTEKGVFHLVDIWPTEPGSFQELRLIVSVVDENGYPLPWVPVAFSYSTAQAYTLSPDFLWIPPPPQRAFITPTLPGGMAEQIQGSTVKAGEPGGVTIYLFEPDYSSDVITGLGALASHAGLHLVFQLQRFGVVSIKDRLVALEDRLKDLEDHVGI